MAERRSSNAVECCILLFHLLRTRLTHVAGNHLWPEVARELGSLGGSSLDGDGCGHFFRTAIAIAFGEELEDAHNKYVMFALDEAGVGKNRTRIVSEFLQGLVDAHPDRLKGEGADEQVSNHLHDFLDASRESSDVEPLGGVLRRAGRVLLLLLSEVRSQGIAFECSLWDWPRLRQYWLDHSGVDLDRLLPEGRSILEQLLKRVGDIMTRQGVAGVMAVGKARVTFPPGLVDGVDPSKPGTIPLTPIRIAQGTSQRDVVICDDSGLTAAGIRKHPPNKWFHAGKNRVCIWRPERFEVQTGPWSTDDSSSLVTGATLEEAGPAGHFWSGSLEDGRVPHVPGVQELQVAPKLRAAFCWRLRESGLSFDLKGFRVMFLDGIHDGTLKAGQSNLWQGQLCEGRPESFGGAQILLAPKTSATDGVLIRLENSEGDLLCDAAIPNPMAADAFLALGAAVDPDRHWFSLEGLDASRDFPYGIHVLCRGTKVIPEARGAQVSRVDPGPGWKGFSVFKITPTVQRDSIELRAGDKEWKLAPGTALSVRAVAKSRVQLGGVEIVGTGALAIAGGGQPVTILFEGLPETRSPEACKATVVIESGEYAFRRSFSEVLKVLTMEERLPSSVEIDLAQLLLKLGVPRLPGRLLIRMEGPGCGGASAEILQLEDYHEIGEARVGDHAGLVLGNQGPARISILSKESVRAVDVLERKRVAGTLRFSDESVVAATWVPLYRDAILVLERQRPVQAEACDLNLLASRWGVRFVGGGDGSWALKVGDLAVAATADYLEASALPGLSDRLRTVPTMELEAFSGTERVRTWSVSLRPTDLSMECHWSKDVADGAPDLVATFSCTALQCHSVQLRVEQDGVEIACPVILGGAPGVRPERITHTARFRLLCPIRNVEGGSPASINAIWHGQVVARADVPPLPARGLRELSAEELRGEVRKLMGVIGRSGGSETALASQLLFATERYAVLTGTMPYSIDSMLASLRGTLPADHQTTFAAGLRMLQALASGNAYMGQDYPINVDGRAGVFLLTLRAVTEVRRGAAGLGRPSFLEAIADELGSSASSHDGSVASWARLLGWYCRAQSARMQAQKVTQEPPQQPEDVARALEDPIVALDAELIDWIRKRAPSKGT